MIDSQSSVRASRAAPKSRRTANVSNRSLGSLPSSRLVTVSNAVNNGLVNNSGVSSGTNRTCPSWAEMECFTIWLGDPPDLRSTSAGGEERTRVMQHHDSLASAREHWAVQAAGAPAQPVPSPTPFETWVFPHGNKRKTWCGHIVVPSLAL